ncbi:hypothetical protein EYF80_036110 [Liparis tanakae]|uniref:Uncharacterized protein n=1 Tax=Liparis tanakae TaxID=230148 RepID=A0A4Z2GLM8_9TELE|nr:hypothetical protein EYF80_036110 [Liparis tanakae]
MTWPRCPHRGEVKHVSPNPLEVCCETKGKAASSWINPLSLDARLHCLFFKVSLSRHVVVSSGTFLQTDARLQTRGISAQREGDIAGKERKRRARVKQSVG